MNPISIDKLYNPQYDLLSISDKKTLLNTLAAIYNLELICFKEFTAFGKSTYTAVYRSHDGIVFVFVPGDTVTLGLNCENKQLQDIFNKENLAELAYPFVDGYEDDADFKNKMTKLIKKRQLSCYTFKGITNTKSLLNSLIRYISVVIFYFTNTNKYVEQIDGLAKSRAVADYEQIDYLIYKDMNKPVWKREWLEQVIVGTFEGKKFMIPKHYHEILTSDYGDYMQLPPLEQRVSHHDFKLWKITKSSK